MPVEWKSGSGRKTQADIVFCIDSTSSMQPCIDGVIKGIGDFARGLQEAANVDYRLRIIGFRDLHDEHCNTPWDITQFTDSVDTFLSQLRIIEGKCNQPFRGAESSLDALYLALNSPWRPSTQKAIVLLTDDNSHDTLHATTYSYSDNGVERIIQDMQELRHLLLFIVAPKYPIYAQIERAVRFADRKVIAEWVPDPRDDKAYIGLSAFNWAPFLRLCGEVVSATSLLVE